MVPAATLKGLLRTVSVTHRHHVRRSYPGGKGATPLGLGRIAVRRPKVAEYGNLGL
jgi:hypothetical protein